MPHDWGGTTLLDCHAAQPVLPDLPRSNTPTRTPEAVGGIPGHAECFLAILEICLGRLPSCGSAASLVSRGHEGTPPSWPLWGGAVEDAALRLVMLGTRMGCRGGRGILEYICPESHHE